MFCVGRHERSRIRHAQTWGDVRELPDLICVTQQRQCNFDPFRRLIDHPAGLTSSVQGVSSVFSLLLREAADF